MKKANRITALALISALLLAACGNSGGSTAATAAPAETAKAAETQAAAASGTKAAETQAPAAAEAPAAEDSTLKVIQNVDPETFQPGTNDDQACQRVLIQIYDQLFRYDENGELQPWLAESYEWDDDTHLRLHLREGVKFSDGSDFTAEDVVWTIQHSIEEALPNSHFNIINADDCTIEDDLTCVLGLKYACGTMPNHLASDECAIASKKAFEEFNGDYMNGAAVGTGPYKLVDYVPGDIIKMTANEYYWREGEPKMKNLDIRIVSSSESAATEARTLDYDIVIGANSREFDQIDAIDGVHMDIGQTAKTVYLLLNTKKPPMDNPKVREAFARAIDVKQTVMVSYGSVGHPAEAFIVPGIAGCNPDTYYKYFGTGHDVETAKALLAEAGYADGIDLEIVTESYDVQRADMAEAMQAQVLDAGINLSILKLENGPMREYIDGGNHQIAIFGFTAQTMEADGFLAQIQPGSVNLNRIGYDRQEFFDTYQKGCATIDDAERAQIWEDCLEMLMEDYVCVPLNHERKGAAVRDDVKGFWWAKDYEEIYFANCYK